MPLEAAIAGEGFRLVLRVVGYEHPGFADEVVKHLAGLVDANVDVRLEITASREEGFPEDVVRTVTENSKTLKFDQHGFEID